MTTRTTIYETWSGVDKYGSSYGNRRVKQINGGNWKAGEKKSTPHNFSAVISEHTMPLGTQTYLGKSEPRSAWAYQPSFRNIDPNMVYIKALNKLYGDVKGADFNAAVSAAELNSSVKMIGDNARRVAKAYKSARRGNWKAAFDALAVKAKGSGADKNAARHWLELQYGWLPLLSDVKGATDFIKKRMEDPKLPRYRVRAQEELSGRTNDNRWTKQYTRRRCQLIYYPTATLSLVDALGLTDPASVLWEKLPYSFVIDWFLPIGPWLSALSASRTLKGQVIRTDTWANYAFGLEGNGVYTFTGGGGAAYKYKEVSRIVTGQPTPPRLPTFNPLEKAWSVRHAINGIALLANLKHL